MGLRLLAAVLPCAFVCSCVLSAQSGGVVQGTVVDPSGGVIPGAQVTLSNASTNYKRSATTGADGSFTFPNVPPNPYHIDAAQKGFISTGQDVEVRSAVPVSVKLALALAGQQQEVEVQAQGAGLVETIPQAHTDVGQDLLSKLPVSSTGSGLSDAITLSSPGVAADSNGMFHPLGDHSQTAYYIDGQPITDQQSKEFSTQMPLNAIQSMELITSTPSAEYGDKTSLVANATTRSGLGAARPFGELDTHYGSFGSYGEDFSVGAGTQKFGYFLAADSERSGRFLDSPEFSPLHDIGNGETIFNRLDYQPDQNDTLHLNLFLARNWFQIPNTYDQQTAGQDQRQQSETYSISPGYIHTFGPSVVMTVDPYLRSDFVNYYPSRDPFADQPATIFEKRSLKNYGTRADVSYVKGINNIKTGIQIERTHLDENFGFGITDPAFVDPLLQPGLLPYDLTRGGSPFGFQGAANIDEFAWYAQDSITWRSLTIDGGLRVDDYNGLTSATSLEPRAGIAYHIKPTGTVLRVGYSHTLETPYNENLILSSATGAGGLASNVFGAYAGTPLQPGHRDQYDTGLEQAIAKHIVVNAEYFWKYTHNAFDFDTLFNTPIVFPINWRESKIDGVSARIALTNYRGFSAYTSLGHTRSRFFGPENGGLVFNSPLDTGAFRIDHDQAFEQTTYVRYQAPLKAAPWVAFTWRYDSGMVAGNVPDLASALALTPDQQAAIGFFCGSQFATLAQGISQCSSGNYGATRITIPAPGTFNPDHNPPRVAPRNLFDLAVGADNILRKERYKVKVQLEATNLTNKDALYNFLSTFSGTHFVEPRAYQATVGLAF